MYIKLLFAQWTCDRQFHSTCFPPLLSSMVPAWYLSLKKARFKKFRHQQQLNGISSSFPLENPWTAVCNQLSLFFSHPDTGSLPIWLQSSTLCRNWPGSSDWETSCRKVSQTIIVPNSYGLFRSLWHNHNRIILLYMKVVWVLPERLDLIKWHGKDPQLLITEYVPQGSMLGPLFFNITLILLVS